MSNIAEKGEQENVPRTEELAGGTTLLVWTIAASLLFCGMSSSSTYESMCFRTIGLLMVIFLAPIGAILFA